MKYNTMFDYGAWKEKGYVYGERDLEMDDLR